MSNVKKEIRQKSFSDIRQELIVSFIFVNQKIRAQLEELCGTQNITLPQYNILRILKGVYPNAHPRAEIRKRMVDRSDVTRLIDRLETAGLVKRISADGGDQRHSLTMISAKGLKVIESLDRPFEATHKKLLKHLDEQEIKSFIAILKKINT